MQNEPIDPYQGAREVREEMLLLVISQELPLGNNVGHGLHGQTLSKFQRKKNQVNNKENSIFAFLFNNVDLWHLYKNQWTDSNAFKFQVGSINEQSGEKPEGVGLMGKWRICLPTIQV